MIYTTPPSHLIDHGWAPGDVFVDVNERLVLDGEVYNIRSFGNLTKPWFGDNITQLLARARLPVSMFL